MRDMLGLRYGGRMVRPDWWCVMRYVGMDSGDVVVRVSLDDLGLLMGALTSSAIYQREVGMVRIAEDLWGLSDQIADVVEARKVDLVRSQGV